MAQKAQQEQLHQRLAQIGINIPLSSVPLFPAGSHLCQWLLQTAEQVASNTRKGRSADGKLPNDLSQVADQGLNTLAREKQGPWLQDSAAEKQQLEQAKEMQQVLESQLAELQTAEAALAQMLQGVQTRHQDLSTTLSRHADRLTEEKSSVARLNARTNELLQDLFLALQEIERLICRQGSTWLAVAADMARYKRLNDEYDKHFNRLGRLPGTVPGGTANGRGAGGHALPHSPAPVRQSHASMTHDEEKAMWDEMQRLRTAFCLGEMELVTARSKLAGFRAQVTQLRQIMAEQLNAGFSHSYAPWLQPAECDRLAARVQDLQKEVNSLSQRNLPCVIEEVARLQDVHILQGKHQYDLAKHETLVRERQTLVEVLQRWGSHGLLLDTLRTSEREALAKVYTMMNDITDVLGDMLTVSKQRHALYERQPTSGGGHHHGHPLPGAVSPLHRGGREGWVGGLRTSGMGLVRSPGMVSGLRSSGVGSLLGKSPGTGAGAAYQALRHEHQARQQLEDHSFLDTLHGVLCHNQQPHQSGGVHTLQASGVPASPSPSTLPSLTNAISQLHNTLNKTQSTALQLSNQQLPKVVQGALSDAQAAHALLCPVPGDVAGGGVCTPVVSDPQLIEAFKELEATNAKLQQEVNKSVTMCNAFSDHLSAHNDTLPLERSVLRLMHSKPDKLSNMVNELQARLDTLQAVYGQH